MPKITGAHSIINSTNPQADRAFLRDVISLPNVDVGDGWLVFALPPSEVAVHPSDKNGVHELYLLTDDVHGLVETMAKRGVACSPARDLGWGVLTQVSLPGGGTLGIYEPRHARPKYSTPARRKGRGTGRGRAKRSRSASSRSRRTRARR